MIKREKIIYTYHDELFHNLIIPNDVDKMNKTSIKLLGNQQLLSAQEIFMLMILLDHYTKAKGVEVPITIKQIHIDYRNRRMGKEQSIPKPDYKSYVIALNSLKKRFISFNIVRKIKLMHSGISKHKCRKLINIFHTKQPHGNTILEYSLGEFGDILLLSRRYSDILPVEIIRLPYKQISALYIGLYLARLIFINRRKKQKQFNVSINSIMKNIMLHQVNGDNTGITLASKLKEHIPNKYTYIDNFRKHLKMVLKMLEENKSISSFEMLPINIDDMNISNYETLKLQINIKKIQNGFNN